MFRTWFDSIAACRRYLCFGSSGSSIRKYFPPYDQVAADLGPPADEESVRGQEAIGVDTPVKVGGGEPGRDEADAARSQAVDADTARRRSEDAPTRAFVRSVDADPVNV